MKASDGTCCPHCGGISGYHFNAWLREHYLGSWAGDAESVQTIDSRFPKTARCVDCGKRVALPEADPNA